MEYKRLPFEQYFIDQSIGNYGGTPTIKVDYKRVDFKEGYDGYYCVLFNNTRNVYQIYFKETCTKAQWISNFKFPHKYYDEFQYKGRDIQLRCATGWAEIYNSMKRYIREEFSILWEKHGEAEVEIIGWSLGSAIAQLCAQDLFFNYGIQSHIFTFGSVKPWFGWKRDMRNYLSDCYKECYNFYAHVDIVGYMVPLLGYFALSHRKLKPTRFCITKLFQPQKWHTEYFKSGWYENIK